MKLGSRLLAQLERCGLSAELAEKHCEISDGDFRETRIEIARAYHARDQAQLPAAHAALRWLIGEPGTIRSVGEPLDLADPETGEVLVSGKPGAVIDGPEGVLVVSWASADWHTDAEPEDDLGALAMGLAAAAGGNPFRVATVMLSEDDSFVCRSRVVTVDEHAALLARIKAAASRPRVACPGDWCGACKQAPYCEAWLARAQTALAVLDAEAPLSDDAEGKLQIPQLDLTTDSAGRVMARIKLVRKAADLAEEQVKSYVRKGGSCVVNGKEYYPGSRDGKESISVASVRELVKPCATDSAEVAGLKTAIFALIKVGDPYEQFGWRSPKPAGSKGRR